MPKDTFFNLPSNKKNQILDVIIDEFYQYGYRDANVTRIVDHAGIAKGSFYQYFENKKDLFKYIMEIAREKKLGFLGDIETKSQHLDFFELLHELYMGGLCFLDENHKLATINDNFLKDADLNFKEEILGESLYKSNEYIAVLLQKGIDSKDLNPNIDLNLISHLITSVSISLGDYYRSQKDHEAKLDVKTYYKLVEQTINLFKDGICSKRY